MEIHGGKATFEYNKNEPFRILMIQQLLFQSLAIKLQQLFLNFKCRYFVML